jgi:hypothetical protein
MVSKIIICIKKSKKKRYDKELYRFQKKKQTLELVGENFLRI